MNKAKREKLEAAARAVLKMQGFEYQGESVLACAKSTDPAVFNTRADFAVKMARAVLKAAGVRCD